MRRFLLLAAAAVLMGAAESPAPCAEGRFWGGLGALSGDITYRIGGLFTSPAGSFNVQFPLSELRWPLDVPVAAAGAEIAFPGGGEAAARVTANLSSYAGKMKDSDWTDPSRPQAKTIYSESDTSLLCVIADLVLRYRVYRREHGTPAAFALGGGWLYGHFDFNASNVDQWYPQNPELGHDRVSSVAITYTAALNVPYLELAGTLGDRRASHLLLSAGFSPVAFIEEADNHVIRQTSVTARLRGDAWKLSLEGRYFFLRDWFLNLRGDLLYFDMRGRDSNLIYGGPDQGETWSLDHHTSSAMFSASLALGVHY